MKVCVNFEPNGFVETQVDDPEGGAPTKVGVSVEVKDGDRLQWTSKVGVPKSRKYVSISNISSNVVIKPFDHCLNNLHRAVVERVFTVKTKEGFSRPPRPQPGVFRTRLAGVKDALYTASFPTTAPVSHQQFVDSYSGRKRATYARALAELREGIGSVEEDAKIDVFVKCEKTDFTHKLDPVPRVISPRDPKYNIRVGRYLKHLEKPLFRSINKMFGHETVIKGYNAKKAAEILRQKWDAYRDPVAIGLDASRFDQHVSTDALEWEHSVYMKCFPVKKHKESLRKLLRWQLKNHCRGYTPDGTLKYTVKGTRMSGDMNTSLGNCLLMCCMIKAYLEHNGVEGHLANNGDDCVVFIERENLGKFMVGLDRWFLEMGFNMAIEEPVDVFEQIEFCQTKPIFDGIGWTMVRKPDTAIAKDSIFLQPYNKKIVEGWLDAVGTGGLCMTGCLPVFQELYAAYVRAGKRRKIPEELLPWSFRHWSQGMDRKYGEVSPQARESFWLAFNMTPDEQICLEKHYQQLDICSDLGEYHFPRIVFP
jgi:hypothetical protein